MHYFSYISADYTLKNNLYKDIFQFLLSQNRMIIPANELEAFKANILAGIADCNSKNPRCNAIEASFQTKSCSSFELNKSAKVKEDLRLYLGYGTICWFDIYSTIN